MLHSFKPQPREKANAAQTSFIREELNRATRRPNRCCETVTALCVLIAQRVFMPSSSLNTTSEGTPRIVDVIGTTVAVDK
jgi:hypothetical protein